MPRFSLKSLLIAAAVVPLAIYGIANASETVFALVATIVVLFWIAMVLMWVESEGQTRAFARGFAISTLFFAVAVLYLQPVYFGGKFLIISPVLDLIYSRLAVWTGNKYPVPYYPFKQVGQGYCCAIIGIIGGWFSAWLYRRRQKANLSSMEAGNP